MPAALVQTTPVNIGGYPSAFESFASLPTVGNVVIIAGVWNPSFGSEPTGVSVLDNQGNEYDVVFHRVPPGDNPQGNGAFIGYCVVEDSTGTFTVTATVTGGGADAGVAVCAQEWSGLDVADLLDQTGNGQQFLNSEFDFSVTASGENTGADRLVIAVVSGRGDDITPVNEPPLVGYSTFFAQGLGVFAEARGFAAYKVVSEIETSSANWGTIAGGSGSGSLVLATFKVAEGGGTEEDLDLQGAAQAHTAQSPTLSIGITLSVDNATHGHSAETTAPSTSLHLTLANGAHGHAAEAVVLSTGISLTVANAAQGHAVESLTLGTTTAVDLVVAAATHGHSVDSPSLTLDTALAVSNAAHGQAADSITLSTTGGTFLTVDNATQAHAAGTVSLTSDSTLAVQSTEHAHNAEAMILGLTVALTVAGASHVHAADGVTLSQVPSISVNDALHAQTSEGTQLTMASWLAVADAWHVQTAQRPTLEYVSDELPETYPLAGLSQGFPLAGQAQTYPLG